MATTYASDVIAAGVAEVRRTTGLQVAYANGRWMVWNHTSRGSSQRPATSDQAQMWNAVLDRLQDAMHPQPPPPPPPQPPAPTWWQRVGFGSPGAPGTAAGTGGIGNNSGVLGALGNTVVGGLSGATIGASIASSAAAGGEAARAVTEGIGSIISSAYGTGVKIGQTILDGALQPLGRTGSALASLFGAGASTIGQLGSTAGRGISGVVGAGGQIIGAGVGAGTAGMGGLIGGAIGLAGGPIGAMGGAAIGAAVGLVVMKITEGLASLFGSVMDMVGEALGAVGDLVSGVFKAAMDIGQDLLQTMMSLANGAASLAQKSGMTIGQAASANNLLAGFGIKGSDVEGLSRNTFLQGGISRAYGIQGEVGSKDYLSSFRERYREKAYNADGSTNALGLIAAQQMAKSTGMEGLIPLANMSKDVFDRQANRSESLQGSLGMSSEQIAKATQDWQGLTATVTQISELVRARFGAELLPFLTGALDKGISWITAHSDDITAGIKNSVTWLTTELPQILIRTGRRGVDIFESATSHIGGAIKGIGDFLTGLSHNAFFRAFQVGLVSFLAAVDLGSRFVSDKLQGIGTVLFMFADNLVSIGNIVISLVNTLASTVAAAGKMPGVKLLPGVGSIVTAAEGIHLDPIGHLDPAILKSLDIRTNLAKGALDFTNSIPGMGKSLSGAGSEITSFGADHSKGARARIDTVESYLKSMSSDIKEIKGSSNATAQNTGKLTDQQKAMKEVDYMSIIGSNLIRSWRRGQSLA